jgi:hypothetical protein
MNILTESSLIKFAKALSVSKFNVAILNQGVAIYDAFDTFKPDIFITTMSALDRARVKNIIERPALRVVLIGDAPVNEHYDELVKTVFPNIIYSNNPDDYKMPVTPFETYSDILLYKDAKFQDKYAADIVCIEDNLGPEILNFTPGYDITFRIFSNNIVNHSNFCGTVIDNNKKDVYASAKISLCSPENKENAWLCGSYVIDLLNPPPLNEILSRLTSDNTEEIQSQRARILESNTTFHLCANLMEGLDLKKESQMILNKLKEIL